MTGPADFRHLFESAPGFIAVLRGPDLVFEITNAAYRKLLNGRDVLGKPFREALPEIAEQGYADLLDEVYRTGKPYVAEHVPVVYDQPGGESRKLYISFVYEPLRDEDGAVTGIFAEGTDVTAAVDAEFARRQAERRLDAVLNNASVSIFLMDERQHCIYMNAAAERLTGYSFEETQGRPLHDVIHHTHPDGTPFPIEDCPIDRAFPEDNNVQGEGVFVHKDGHFYPVAFTASPVRDEASKTVGTIIEVRDISAERAVEAELRESRDRLAEESHALEILNRTGGQIAAELDLEKIVQLVVDAGVDLTGAEFGAFFYNVTRGDGESYMLYALSGAEPSQFDFGMPRATKVFAPTFRGEGVIRSHDITQDPRYGHEAPHYGMPEGHLPVRAYLAVPVVSRSGEVIGGLFFGHSVPGTFGERAERVMTGLAGQAAIAIDNARLFAAAQLANQTLEQRVTERTLELEQANEALRQAQKMEAIGQLTGGIAHDFNNLLTVIRGSADILRRPGLSEEKRARYVDAIAETADRAAKLTNQLLAFARRQALEPVVFDVPARIRALTEMVRPIMGSRIETELDLDCGHCFVKADPNQLETAILNMSVNARDAMDGEGTLTIRVSPVDEIPADLANPAAAGEFVAIAIGDTGSGIAPEEMARIFEPFFTTKGVGHGTGLGLSQVFGFAKQSGGEIRVDSALGRGSTFTLYLPRVAEPPPEEAVDDGAATRHAGRGRILVVEDNRQVGEFATELLADLGYESLLACDAEEALATLAREADAIDLVFTDVVMPGRSGVELAQDIARAHPRLPVVLTSGYSHVLADQGTHGFPLLHKPYSVKGLSEALSDALRMPETA
ncbi:MAG: PAS domain-containing protein [Allosphingosinicella sp.]|uniref:PAS domain-containing protein n=1 Tax=Allosphingosinicella sp. TaxID=2823234 RepID=UPI00393C57E3